MAQSTTSVDVDHTLSMVGMLPSPSRNRQSEAKSCPNASRCIPSRLPLMTNGDSERKRAELPYRAPAGAHHLPGRGRQPRRRLLVTTRSSTRPT